MLQYSRTSDILLRGGFSLDNSYYLFCGSFGDRWYIASLLGHLFDHDDKAYVIAVHGDMELLRIFLGERMNRVIPADENSALQIHRACQADPNSYMPSADSGTALRASPQRGCIRSLHLIDYPYFCELVTKFYLKYLDAEKTIMHLSRDSKMAMPTFFNSADEELADALLNDVGLLNCKSAILNPVNFSNLPLSLDAWSTVCDLLRQHGYKFGFNIAQSSDPEMAVKLRERTGASIFSMPGHLMKIIYDKITLCVGAYGGGMAIADAFGKCSVFSIYTSLKYFPGANNLSLDFHDFHSMRAEPRPVNSRLARGSSYLSGIPADDIALIERELAAMLNEIEQL